ncbi:MAG: dihydrofolate reductase, partial [Bacteroidia bacterium]|nr:dihydrofolate reductase [Bacteroidia bacterium]
MKNILLQLISVIFLTSLITSCNNNSTSTTTTDSTQTAVIADTYDSSFKIEAESFADLQTLRYQVPGFDQLSLQQKELAYYLSEAALSGREIIYDQKSRYGIMLRKTLETVYGTYKGDRTSTDWKNFEEYCGRFWFSNGNHHHYSNEKFFPACSFDYLSSFIKSSDTAYLPKEPSETV